MAQDFQIQLQATPYAGPLVPPPVFPPLPPIQPPPGTIFAQSSFATSQGCNRVTVKQLTGRQAAFVIVDPANGASPIKVKPGGQYTFDNAGLGFGPNVSVGTIQVSDIDLLGSISNPLFMTEIMLLSFLILQR